MDAFDSSMFPDTIVLQAKVRPTPVDSQGGSKESWADPGVSHAAYVEVIADRTQRADTDQAQPKSIRRYKVFTSSDTGALVDDHAIWAGRTLAVLEPSVPQLPLFMFECADVE